ncbi:hypothetical protein [Salipiger sp.]|uniref:hypothetical protein n=1 Tax=Salipiger sp. TaxID=2078585 RepID=UPI003A986DF6
MKDDLFSRLATVHRPDCAIFADGPAPAPVPDPETMARDFGSDAAARYAAACRPLYEDLRRVVGQLAGLLILAQLTTRAEVADLDELSTCRARWQQATDRLVGLAVPAPLQPHLDQLRAALDFSGQAVRTFSDLRPHGDNTAAFDRIAASVQRAYAHLRAASSDRAGLEMVDLAHACCSCGR